MKVNEENAGRRFVTILVLCTAWTIISLPLLIIISIVLNLIGLEYIVNIFFDESFFYKMFGAIMVIFYMYDFKIGLIENLRLEQKKYKWYQIIGEED